MSTFNCWSWLELDENNKNRCKISILLSKVMQLNDSNYEGAQRGQLINQSLSETGSEAGFNIVKAGVSYCYSCFYTTNALHMCINYSNSVTQIWRTFYCITLICWTSILKYMTHVQSVTWFSTFAYLSFILIGLNKTAATVELPNPDKPCKQEQSLLENQEDPGVYRKLMINPTTSLSVASVWMIHGV